jgi:hypothetical protein
MTRIEIAAAASPMSQVVRRWCGDRHFAAALNPESELVIHWSAVIVASAANPSSASQ